MHNAARLSSNLISSQSAAGDNQSALTIGITLQSKSNENALRKGGGETRQAECRDTPAATLQLHSTLHVFPFARSAAVKLEMFLFRDE